VDLERALEALSSAMTAVGIPRWRPPESFDDLEELEAEIAPLRLPEDVRRFWLQVDAPTLRVYADPWITSPKNALRSWRQSRDEFRSTQPLALMSVGNEGLSFMSVELDVGAISGGALFEWALDDANGFTYRFDGIAGWLAYIAELVERGLYERIDRNDGPIWLVPGHENFESERTLRPKPTLHIADDILAWPEHWQRVNGVREEDLRLRGATHTIAEVLASPPDAELRTTIAGRVTDYAGGGMGAYVRVDDGTGTLNVNCPPETTLVGPRNGEWNEFDIVVPPGARQVPVDPDTAAEGIDDDVERVTAVLMARYGGPAGATAEAVRPMLR
jgi:hypothetical protein